MIITFQLGQKLAKADLTKPIDISLETKEKQVLKLGILLQSVQM